MHSYSDLNIVFFVLQMDYKESYRDLALVDVWLYSLAANDVIPSGVFV